MPEVDVDNEINALAETRAEWTGETKLEALAWATSFFERLYAKCDEYGIRRPAGGDAAGWFVLALRLAAEHEPGMNPFPGKPGAPRSSSQLTNDIILFHAVETSRARTQRLSGDPAANGAPRTVCGSVGLGIADAILRPPPSRP